MSTSTPPSSHTRNVCILAHVDHGKSSYADSLLASNGIISSRMAGQIRYLDSREDEQERGITMESSAVSLKYKVLRRMEKESSKTQEESYRINLIDTPGHVDFSSEVFTASRLCDGALVLVDVVEGVCTQTITVLRQAYLSSIRPLIVFNKLDRLILELRLTPNEAYHHLYKLLEQVNAVVGSFYGADRMEEYERWMEEKERKEKERKERSGESGEGRAVVADGEGKEEEDEDGGIFEERDDSSLYFEPSLGDVIFSSAIDGMAFRLSTFSTLYSTKLKIKESRLRKVLWGDWFLDNKSKRVVNRKWLEKEGKGRIGKLKPMFVQFVLENIWAVYDAVAINPNPEKIQKIATSLSLKIRPQELKSKDPRPLLQSIFSQWLPLAPTTFRAIIDRIPPPHIAQSVRLPRILHPELGLLSSFAFGSTQTENNNDGSGGGGISKEDRIEPLNETERDIYEARSGQDSDTIVYVSKMFAVPVKDLPQNQRRQLTAEEMRERARVRKIEEEAGNDSGGKVGIEVSGNEEGEKKEKENGTVPTNGVKELLINGEATTNKNTNGAAPQDGNAKSSPSSTTDTSEALIGFARIYSGTLRPGDTLSCLLPKFTPSLPPTHPVNINHITQVTIKNLYVIMGRELALADEVIAGNVVGIEGLEGKVMRSATLCKKGTREKKEGEKENQVLVNLAGVQMESAPIVRVALEPKRPSDMPKLVEGLRLLNQADPCVETFVQETGEHVILGAGELHLERCLRDLRDRFAKIRIQQSPPIVPFRETAVKASDMAAPKTKDAPRGTIRAIVHDGYLSFTIRSVPLPDSIIAFLQSHTRTIKAIQRDHRKIGRSDEVGEMMDAGASGQGQVSLQADMKPETFWEELEAEFAKCGREWIGMADKVWSFGPRRTGANMLIDRLPGEERSLKKRLARLARSAVASKFTSRPHSPPPGDIPSSDAPLVEALDEAIKVGIDEPDDNNNDGAGAASASAPAPTYLREFDESIDTAFQIATARGPLCAEPVYGMAFFVDALEMGDVDASKYNRHQVMGGLISTAQDAFRNSLLDWSPRLAIAMYSCDIQASTEVLGKVYAVIARRRGRVIAEEMKEGTSFFTIKAMLPVVESFGFADDIRKKTSGAASPQLVFHGFEVLDQDPYWVPTTEEELEDLGDKADRENIAKRYMDQVRKRKGLFVERRVVEHAEKQRTMKK